MPTTFHKAEPATTDLLREVVYDHHRDLHTAGVQIGVIVCENPDGDALKHHGTPAFANIRVVSPVDRVGKGYDAELRIDGGKWERLHHARRVALLDHELSHLKLKKSWSVAILDANKEPTGETELRWDTDDAGRPQLKTIPGDWETSDGFVAVVARHGLDAIEYASIDQAKRFADEARRAGEGPRLEGVA